MSQSMGLADKISLKCVCLGLIDNIAALVQMMAWCQTGDKSLSAPMLAQFSDAYIRHPASMS